MAAKAKQPAIPATARLTRAFVVSTTFLLAGGLVFGLLWGLQGLEARAATMVADHEITVDFAWPPLPGRAPDQPAATWLPDQVRNDLLDIAYGHLGPDQRPFEPDAIEALSIALNDTGWFEAPPRVTRQPGARISVNGSWRIPGAVVRSDGKDHLISWKGELLPLSYERGLSGQRIILGAGAPRPTDSFGRPAFGQPWPGDDIKAALDLLSLIRPKAYWKQVTGIDTSQLSTLKRLVINTDTGSKVVWGSPPGVRAFGDQPDDAKLQRLDQLFQRWGRIDAGRRIVEVYGPIILVDDRPETP